MREIGPLQYYLTSLFTTVQVRVKTSFGEFSSKTLGIIIANYRHTYSNAIVLLGKDDFM